jgi:hypothetical protein
LKLLKPTFIISIKEGAMAKVIAKGEVSLCNLLSFIVIERVWLVGLLS